MIHSKSNISISTNYWTHWKLAKSILILGIPLIMGELGSIAQQFADTMMVGHYGTTDLAAAGFVNSIFYFVIFLTLGMSYASTPLIGSAFGRKDFKEIYRFFTESIIVNLLVGIFFVFLLLIIYFNLEALFFNKNSEIFHQPLEILDLSKGYMLILIASIPFMTLFYACKQYLDGIGKTSASMWVMLFANLLNIGLNWCLIFGNCGFKPMGLLGAGLSTLISRIIQLIIIAWVVYKTDVISNIKKDIKPTRNGVIEQLKLGLPISIQLGLEIATFNICGIFMGWLGALPLAAHQTMYTISTLCFQILYGIGAAGTILISQFFGVGAWENIRRTANAAFRVGLISVAFLTTVIFLLFERLASFFTNDYEVIKLMWLILPSFVLYQLGDCMQIVYANALRGLEDTKPLALIAAISYIFICIPLCYIISFVLGKGIAGVWMGIPIGLTIAGILFAMRFKTKLKTLSLK